MIEKTNGYVDVHHKSHKWRIPVYAEISTVCTQMATLHDPAEWELNVRDIIHIGHEDDARLKHDLIYELVSDTCNFDKMAFEVV